MDQQVLHNHQNQRQTLLNRQINVIQQRLRDERVNQGSSQPSRNKQA